MIGASSLGSSFGRLGNYLAGDPDRVEWAETRNTYAGQDLGNGPAPFTPREVAAEMDRRAGAERTERPVYHVAIAFDPDDRPTDAEVRGAVDRTLEDLGLEKHQALVVRHNDTDHAHVHVMVNRVGEDGRVWSPWRERVRLRSSMEAQERELGVRRTGRNADGERAREREAGVPDRARGDVRGYASEVRSKALGDLKGARSWADLDRRLERHGWRVERRGQGAVVTDGAREAKLSSVARSVSRSKLEKRLGPLRDHERLAHERGRERGQAPERAPVRGPERPSPERPSPERPSPERPSPERPSPERRRGPGRPPSTPRPTSAQVRARRAGRGAGGPRPSLAGEARRAAAVRSRVEGAVHSMAAENAETDPARPAARAARALVRAASERATAERSTRRSLADRTLRARAVHRDVRPGGRVDRLARAVRERRALGRIEAGHERAERVVSGVQAERAAAAQRLGTDEKRARAAFEDGLSQVYADPVAARDAFRAAVREGGGEAASRVLAERPETYGRLRVTERTRALGLRTERTTGPARAAAPEAARLGAAHAGVRARANEAVTASRALRVDRAPRDEAERAAFEAARAREAPAVRAAYRRAERTMGELSPGGEGWLPARAERAEARAAGRVGRAVEPKAERARPAPDPAEAVRRTAGAARSADVRQLTADERVARSRFEDGLSQVYADPVAARDAFRAAVREGGGEAASRVLAERPETYGRLRVTERTRALGLRTERTTGPARAAAPEAARWGRAHVSVSGRLAAARAASKAAAAERTRAAGRAQGAAKGRGRAVPGRDGPTTGARARASRVQRAVAARIGGPGVQALARAARAAARGIERD